MAVRQHCDRDVCRERPVYRHVVKENFDPHQNCNDGESQDENACGGGRGDGACYDVIVYCLRLLSTLHVYED